MNQNKNFQLNIGSSSIILIFVVLCLIAFSVLSLVSAHADASLSHKVLVRTTSYYEACNKAEESLASINDTLYQLYTSAQNQTQYFEMAGGKTISYSFPLSDIQSLTVELEILYPETEKGPFYNITKWQVLTTDTPDHEEPLHLLFE